MSAINRCFAVFLGLIMQLHVVGNVHAQLKPGAPASWTVAQLEPGKKSVLGTPRAVEMPIPLSAGAVTANAVAIPVPGCDCNLTTLMGTQANIGFANYGVFVTPTVGAGIEVPSTYTPAPSWLNPGRFNIDIFAKRIRIEFARDAYYGPGSNLSFGLNPTGCGTPKVSAIGINSNRQDALSIINQTSSFGTPANKVVVGFGTGGILPSGDWMKGDWIEVYLEFVCQDSPMPPHSVTVMTPGPVNACAPYKLCFDVQVPTGPVVGKSVLTLTLHQNGNPTATTTLTHIMTSSGVYCFPMPAIAPGPGFDYVMTTQHYLGTALITTEIDALPPIVSTGGLPKPQGQQQGFNNDLICEGPPSSGSTCCPPMSHEMLKNMWNHTGQDNGSYTKPLNTSATETASFVAGMNAYLPLVKYLCPQTVALKVEFLRGPVALPSTAGGPVGPLSSPTVSVAIWNGPKTATWLNGQLNLPSGVNVNGVSIPANQAVRTTVRITGIDANGNTVNCGFDAAKCAEGDTFGWFPTSTNIVMGGAGSPSPSTK